MVETDIGSAVASDLTNAFTDYSVDSVSTDGAQDQKETRYTQTKWAQYFGYYKSIPELNSTIDARATWTVGKGMEMDEMTTMIFDRVKGMGNDTFDTILMNMIRQMHVGGDAFAEIITDDRGILINLKPLDPEVMVTVVSRQGIILKYEQTSKVKKAKKTFQPEQIFHLMRNRIGDEIHGVSVVEKLEKIILMRNESMTDYKEMMHRFMKPRYIFHLDTDDTAKIAAFKAKTDKAWSDGENMYIPKGAVVPEQMSISPNSTLNPLTWIESLNDYFYEACATPKIVVGNAKSFTDAAVKTVYLAFQQSVEADQLYIEEQVLSQINLVINLIFPASLENDMLSDEKKDGDMTMSKPSDTQPTEVSPMESEQ